MMIPKDGVGENTHPLNLVGSEPDTERDVLPHPESGQREAPQLGVAPTPREVDNDDLAFGSAPNLFTIDFGGAPRE